MCCAVPNVYVGSVYVCEHSCGGQKTTLGMCHPPWIPSLTWGSLGRPGPPASDFRAIPLAPLPFGSPVLAGIAIVPPYLQSFVNVGCMEKIQILTLGRSTLLLNGFYCCLFVFEKLYMLLRNLELSPHAHAMFIRSHFPYKEISF